MKRNERTLQMIQNYMPLRLSGKKNKEIAKTFGLSTWTLYHYLPEIAKLNGVSRESLLDVPHSQHQLCERISEPVKPIDFKSSGEVIQNAIKIMGEFKGMVDIAIGDAERFTEEMKGGELYEHQNDEI